MTTIDPTTPRDVDALEEQLSRPTPGVCAALAKLDGDLLLLGAGGKMGPTLARMAVRATQQNGQSRRVIAVSRFSSETARRRLNECGAETIPCDLLDPKQIETLPDAPHVIAMTGMKFGAAANPHLTWAMNCYLPALVCRRFPHSRMIVFSSGNIYGLTPAERGGSRETDPLNPVGEYAMTVLGRERMYSYFSIAHSIPTVLLRLNYATELRYGVLVDLARRVWLGEPIDLSMGWVNVIWQSEANAYALQAMTATEVPPTILNLAGSEILRVREVARRFGELLGREPQLTGTELPDALLSDATRSYELFGKPAIDAEQMIRWTADWVARGGEYHGKPTRFEVRAGEF